MQYKQLLIKSNKTENEEVASYLQTDMDVMLIQMAEKEGIKRFGEVAIAEIIRYLKQIDEGAMPRKYVVLTTDSEIWTRYF